MAADHLALLGGLPQDTFRLGTLVLVEYEPHSLWYEASITFAAKALASGIRTDYHTFQHMPDDVVAALEKHGVDVADAQRRGLFRIIDSYSVQTGLSEPVHQTPYEFASQSLRISEWKRGSDRVLREPGERRLLHIDENDSVLMHYNREEEVFDFFRTRAFEAARKREFLFVHGFMQGVHTKAFYRRFESLADVVLDFQTREAEGHLEHLLRVRAIRGMVADSRWRLLTATPKGEVRVLGPARERAPAGRARRPMPAGQRTGAKPLGDMAFGNRKAATVFDSLVRAFVDDSMKKRLRDEDAGWRSLVQIARDTALAPSSLYPRKGATNPIMGELMSRGLVETRVIPGARGRGGVTLRVRVAREHVPIPEHGRPRRAP